MMQSKAGIWKWTVALGAFLVIGAACNSHELNPFEASVTAAAVDKTEQGEVRPVDILFVVDNSSSMCEEQSALRENFNSFLEILGDANADFQLAVINTDMTDFDTGFGTFLTAPGSYDSGNCPVVPDTSGCPASTGPVLSATNYRDAEGNIEVARLQNDFACMALTGINGDFVEMGLETMRTALSNQDQLATTGFLRDGALLAVVFVTDENDCSDGTRGAQLGPVYAAVPTSGDGVCEYNRNIEDSCTYASGDALLIDPDTGRYSIERNMGPVIPFEDVELSGRDWCNQGNRDVVQQLQGSLELDCPGGECSNQLIARREYYDFLVNLVAQKNHADVENEEDRLAAARNDIIISTIINTDDGTRVPRDGALPPVCGTAGQLGYRYQQFAEMFGDDRRVVAPICDVNTGNPTDFAPSLSLIAETIGRAISGVCLQSYPLTCTSDDTCPGDQTCGEPFFAGNPDFEYRVCSGFNVRVELVTGTDAEGNQITTRLVRDQDYTISFTSQNCLIESGSPLELTFTQAPPTGAELIISYPRTVAPVFD